MVLDEADEMLDLGFIEDVEKILRHVPQRAPDGALLGHDAAAGPAPRRELHVRPGDDQRHPEEAHRRRDRAGLPRGPAPREGRRGWSSCCAAEEPEQAIIFCRTKIGASRLDKTLRDKGLDVKALHGDMSQGSRDGVMIAFKDHRVRLLVATDIAARGLDIEHVTHVINYDVPDTTEAYVHRIGRTGRVGRTGRAITLVTPSQREEIARIEREAKVTHRRVGAARGAARARAAPAAPRARAETRARREKPAAPPTAPREAVRQPRRAQRHQRGGPALGAARGGGVPDEAIESSPRAGPLLVRRARRRAGRAGRRAPRRHQAQGPRDPPRGRAQLAPARVRRVSSAIRPSRSLEVDRLGDAAAGAQALGLAQRLLLAVGADDQHRGLAARVAQLAQDVEPRLPRHHRVEQDQVRLLVRAGCGERLDRLLRRRRR